MKKFNTMTGIGKAKYVVNFYKGILKCEDGSEKWDMATFSNKKSFNSFVKTLKEDGYVKRCLK